MPYVTVCHEDQNGSGPVSDEKEQVRLYYHTYGKGATKVLLIMGFAAGLGAWGPQLSELVGTNRPNEDEDGNPLADEEHVVDSSRNGTNKADSLKSNVTCVAFDNRGVGRSSAPEDKSRYTTKIMAKDALALMSSLGWEKAHIVGHSMGGMIASKLAVIAPDRVASLALVSVSCGGYHAVPKLTWRSLNVMYRLLKAKTIEQRAWVDLDTHYSKDHLEEIVEGKARRDALFEEYVNNLSNTGLQTTHGVDGHFNACWTHSITKNDVKVLESGNILVSVIHGRHDVIAHVSAGELMALRLRRLSKMVHLPGGHMIPLEKPKELGEAVRSLIEAAERGVSPLEWTKGSSLAERIEQVGVGSTKRRQKRRTKKSSEWLTACCRTPAVTA